MQKPVSDKAHVRFRYLWQWNGAETGYVQPTFAQLVDARGADTGGYHFNPITAWQIKSDGRVLNRPENSQ